MSPPLVPHPLPIWPPTLRWAMAISIVIHGTALVWLPDRQQAGLLARQPLHMILSPARPPVAQASPPVPSLEAPKPPDLLPTSSGSPRRAIEASRAPMGNAQPMAAEASASQGISAPAIVPTTGPVASILEPPVTRATSPDPATLSAYSRQLAGLIATNQRYPRLAQLRQWQGTTLLQLKLTTDGGVQGIRVVSSSGHDILDTQALEMLRAAMPLPPLPPSLSGRVLLIDVPVVFRLAS